MVPQAAFFLAILLLCACAPNSSSKSEKNSQASSSAVNLQSADVATTDVATTNVAATDVAATDGDALPPALNGHFSLAQASPPPPAAAPVAAPAVTPKTPPAAAPVAPKTPPAPAPAPPKTRESVIQAGLTRINSANSAVKNARTAASNAEAALENMKVQGATIALKELYAGKVAAATTSATSYSDQVILLLTAAEADEEFVQNLPETQETETPSSESDLIRGALIDIQLSVAATNTAKTEADKNLEAARKQAAEEAYEATALKCTNGVIHDTPGTPGRPDTSCLSILTSPVEAHTVQAPNSGRSYNCNSSHSGSDCVDIDDKMGPHNIDFKCSEGFVTQITLNVSTTRISRIQVTCSNGETSSAFGTPTDTEASLVCNAADFGIKSVFFNAGNWQYWMQATCGNKTPGPKRGLTSKTSAWNNATILCPKDSVVTGIIGNYYESPRQLGFYCGTWTKMNHYFPDGWP